MSYSVLLVHDGYMGNCCICINPNFYSNLSFRKVGIENLTILRRNPNSITMVVWLVSIVYVNIGRYSALLSVHSAIVLGAISI